MARADEIEEVARLILSVSSVPYDEATTERRTMARAAAEKVLIRSLDGWKGQNFARDLRANVEKALAVAKPVLLDNGPGQAETITGYTLPSGLRLMLQANARNLLETLPQDGAA